MNNVFIGGAWPYANYYMHVGHLAALLPGDVLARFYRLNGDNVIYVSGSDCHGTPITLRAKKENKNPAEIANFYHKEFETDFNNLNFSYDYYGATMQDYHVKTVQEFFTTLYNNNLLYEKQEEQEFCPKCNTFLSDREIIGECNYCGGKAEGDQCKVCLRSLTPKDINHKKCAICGTAVEIKLNKHLYFKLSNFQNELSKYVESHKDDWRVNAYNESLKYLEMGLIDRATTRQINWGIVTPVKGFEDKRIYVWFEAVMGYLSTGMKVAQEKGIDFNEFFTDNKNLTTIYVHGKDNIPFHTIIFPALVSGINEAWQLPKQIISSEYITINNAKMSKSTGNLFTVRELTHLFDADTIRFYTIYNNPEKKDANFSLDEIVQQHNKFLVGVIGNFVNRNVSFINKKFGGVFTEGVVDDEVLTETQNAYAEVKQLLMLGELRAALQRVVEYATFANKFYDTKQPWVLAHDNPTEFNNVSYSCAYIIENFANLLYPFIPSSAVKIGQVFNPNFSPSWQPISLSGNVKVENSGLLFNRLDEKEIMDKYNNQ